MQKPPTPNNELSRLKYLNSLQLLDTEGDIDLDRITQFAAKLFCVPVALISIVDEERQWFKSKVGLEATQTPRDISFCGHAILGDSTFVVENTLLDERFSDNPLVTGEVSIRFYAGVPLKMLSGFKIGTLCIIDNQPREFRKQDAEILEKLASKIVKTLEEKHVRTLK
ncbi:GAF domain-containing protein [Pseudoalteromonas phenolica]|uniref:GAF domain/diguanylate cyclase domain-containing protein n=1 Tax=Pseudoalteromonas phenolica TaxID=161398 RepID=A0A0S2K1Y0_9GAMM|nr:GAF domain-containing protein [Pseudoalteromonas phenolica]ALO42217.1 GAF domain/diguanylate cyclase domain-containing protein [Pseudoalteromonas phenolica]MBE0356690.1 hypothetical protein [Pseudoalteromonas phenolica O-BC30]RXE94794.1 GAF domain-containing protein [Pseudoalteromonas phenolica O-BC30]